MMIQVNVLLLMVIFLFTIAVQMNRWFFKGRYKIFNQIIKKSRLIHPFLGLVIIVIGFWHGYQMLGGQFLLHTGNVLLFSLLITAGFGFFYKHKKKKLLRKIHLMSGSISLILFLLHYFNPWLLS